MNDFTTSFLSNTDKTSSLTGNPVINLIGDYSGINSYINDYFKSIFSLPSTKNNKNKDKTITKTIGNKEYGGGSEGGGSLDPNLLLLMLIIVWIYCLAVIIMYLFFDNSYHFEKFIMLSILIIAEIIISSLILIELKRLYGFKYNYINSDFLYNLGLILAFILSLAMIFIVIFTTNGLLVIIILIIIIVIFQICLIHLIINSMFKTKSINKDKTI